ncbi:MAG: FtsH protease activity modulator HflK [Pseudomonadota bacterium]
MAWGEKGGGGPWGGGGGRRNGGGGPWGAGSGGGGGGPTPPDIEDLIRKGQDNIKKFVPGGFGGKKLILVGALIAFVGWMATGFYRVEPAEQGVELIFGEVVGAPTQPGLNYNLPWPVGTVITPEVTTVNRVEVGFQSAANFGRPDRTQDVPAESLMLTGDENIIDIQFVVFWQIADPIDYLFNIRNPDGAVKTIAESAMREIIGRTQFEFARTQGRGDVQAAAKGLIQETLDNYEAGIIVRQVELQKIDPPASVIDAFRDVQAARADKERSVNEAQAYSNERIERANGASDQVIREAEAYREERVARSEGEANRFSAVLNEYNAAPEIVSRRLYLQTMEEVLSGMDKTFVETGEGGGVGAVPFLSLNELQQRRNSVAAPRSAARPATTGSSN